MAALEKSLGSSAAVAAKPDAANETPKKKPAAKKPFKANPEAPADSAKAPARKRA